MNDIINELVILMIQVNTELPKAKGQDKKKWVIKQMKEIITLDNHVEDLIIAFIDLLIQVENGELVINKKVKNGCIDCFSFLKNKSKNRK